MANDLTWEQLAAALPNGAITFTGTTITLDAEIITGDAYTALGNEGVSEFIHKLLNGASTAQTTANTSLPVGSRLAAFPRVAFGVPSVDPSDGKFYALATHTIQLRIPLSTESVSGQTG